MAKAGAKIGLTLKLFKNSQYEFIRPELEISEIDTSKTGDEIKKEIERAVKVSRMSYEALTEEMNKLIEEQRKALDSEVKKSKE